MDICHPAYAKVAATPLQLNLRTSKQCREGYRVLNKIFNGKMTVLIRLISLRSQQETRLDNLVSKSTTGNNAAWELQSNALNQADKNVTCKLQNQITSLFSLRDSLNGIRVLLKMWKLKRMVISVKTFVYIAKESIGN
jgi:hypothetical protein